MVGKLDYAKWDNLELSDDSDVEVHPNVDKKSFIRWKQRDIHEKREIRKQELGALKAERDINEVLKPMLERVCTETQAEGSAFYSREVAKLTAGREARGNKDGPNGPVPDDMMLSLLLQINEEPSVKGKSGAELDEGLGAKLKEHQGRLEQRQKDVKAEIVKMEEEEKRKITSDSLREGWSAGFVNKEEEEEAAASKEAKGKDKGSSTIIETLHPGSSRAAEADTGGKDEDELPTLLPSMRAFAKLPSCIPSLPLSASSLPTSFNPVRDVKSEPFDAALNHLAKNKELLREETNTTDALLVEAFQAQMRGEGALARRCVEKGLLVQYCNKLGKDGVNLFFRRMTQTNGKATVVYFNDVLSTYTRIANRCKELQSQPSAGEEPGGEEQIQLVAEDPNTVISFEVPEGPPPEQIELEGELAEKMDPEEVRQLLQNRWDLYQSFPANLRNALESKSLDAVNQILGAMKVEQAEEIVGKLDQANILSLSSGGVRDATGT